MKAGDCAFIDCHHSYSHTTDENLWTLRWCHFYGPLLSLWSAGEGPAFRPVYAAPFRACWESIFAIAGSSDYIRDMKINEGFQPF